MFHVYRKPANIWVVYIWTTDWTGHVTLRQSTGNDSTDYFLRKLRSCNVCSTNQHMFSISQSCPAPCFMQQCAEGVALRLEMWANWTNRSGNLDISSGPTWIPWNRVILRGCCVRKCFSPLLWLSNQSVEHLQLQTNPATLQQRAAQEAFQTCHPF